MSPDRDRREGRIEAIALAGIPEVRAGDDLADLICAALERSDGVLPLLSDDVVVVTQKVVSKAEGAIVDLTTIEPRPEAVAFAERWDRDPRQIEVVLREARRVVRMEHGVLITETPHGFICANGGVDASNVGPESGSVVTLLPRDPDGSARGDPRCGPSAVRDRRPGDRLGLLRAPMALGHHGRRDRRLGADPDRGPPRQRPTPTVG